VPNYTDVTHDSRLVMAWLRAGVPITLLADLAGRGGPLSREILASEALAPDLVATVPRPRAKPSSTVASGTATDTPRAQAPDNLAGHTRR
jgi:hypothetical protein